MLTPAVCHDAGNGVLVPPPDDRAHVDAMALAYRAGRGDLGALDRAVEHTFRVRLDQTIRRHMPTLLDAADARQEARLIVDRLAHRTAEGTVASLTTVA
jgi:hypothetical protein